MKQRVLIFALVLALISAGFVAGSWVERSRPVPPPPPALMAVLTTPAIKVTPAMQTRLVKLRPLANRSELTDAIAKIKPQIDAYQDKLAAIEHDFESALLEVLTPDQRTSYEVVRQKLAATRDHHQSSESAASLSAEEILALQNRPTYSVFNMVVIDMKLSWLAHELDLDSAQVEQVKALLQTRRARFLALVDATPPPSLLLSDLATAATRLSKPLKLLPATTQDGNGN